MQSVPDSMRPVTVKFSNGTYINIGYHADAGSISSFVTALNTTRGHATCRDSTSTPTTNYSDQTDK